MLAAQSQANLAELYVQTIGSLVTGTLKIPHERTKWCPDGPCLTMVYPMKLQHFGDLALDAWRRGVPGDVFEAGVWKGGACMYMAAIMRAYPELARDNNTGNRRIVLADRFENMPERTSAASEPWWSSQDFNHMTLHDVQSMFEKLGLLADNVRFLVGPFVSSLQSFRLDCLNEGRRLSILRIDADMYESYADVLYWLFGLLSIGGFLVCDDCVEVTETDRALNGFMQHHAIRDKRQAIPGSTSGAFWRKEADPRLDLDGYGSWVEARQPSKMNNLTTQSPFLASAIERLALARIESYVVTSIRDLDLLCARSHHLIILWIAPLSADPRKLSRHDLLWTLNVAEALRPDWTSCAFIAVIDSATPLHHAFQEALVRAEIYTWHGRRGSFIGLGAFCGTMLSYARTTLENIVAMVNNRLGGVGIEHFAYIPGIAGTIRSWLSGSCHEGQTSPRD